MLSTLSTFEQASGHSPEHSRRPEHHPAAASGRRHRPPLRLGPWRSEPQAEQRHSPPAPRLFRHPLWLLCRPPAPTPVAAQRVEFPRAAVSAASLPRDTPADSSPPDHLPSGPIRSQRTYHSSARPSLPAPASVL